MTPQFDGASAALVKSKVPSTRSPPGGEFRHAAQFTSTMGSQKPGARPLGFVAGLHRSYQLDIHSGNSNHRQARYNAACMSDIPRRTLLQALPAVLAPAVMRAQASPNDRIRVAFVGVGNRGSFLLANMLQVAGIEVIAICDVNPTALDAAITKVAASGKAPIGYSDYRKLLERKDIDAVVSAVPDFLHRQVHGDALLAGKNVYGEKPLALNAADGRELVKLAEQAKGIFQAGFQLRHDPGRAASMRFIHGGGLGKVLYMHGIRHGGDIPREIPWYFDKDKSGDIIVDQGIHILDLFTWAVDQAPLRAMGSGGISLFHDQPKGRTIMDNYSVTYDYPNNVRVSFSHQYFDPPGFTGIHERVFGDKAAIELPTATWMERQARGEHKLEVPDAGKDSTLMSLSAFVDNVRKNNRNPLNNARSAYRSLLVALLGRTAIYEGRVVRWEEVAGA